MNEAADQLRYYVLLSMEAELLSQRSVSPYISEAYLRLSKFWLIRATEIERNPDMGAEFHAPTRVPESLTNR